MFHFSWWVRLKQIKLAMFLKCWNRLRIVDNISRTHTYAVERNWNWIACFEPRVPPSRFHGLFQLQKHLNQQAGEPHATNNTYQLSEFSYGNHKCKWYQHCNQSYDNTYFEMNRCCKYITFSTNRTNQAFERDAIYIKLDGSRVPLCASTRVQLEVPINTHHPSRLM